MSACEVYKSLSVLFLCMCVSVSGFSVCILGLPVDVSFKVTHPAACAGASVFHQWPLCATEHHKGSWERDRQDRSESCPPI